MKIIENNILNNKIKQRSLLPITLFIINLLLNKIIDKLFTPISVYSDNFELMIGIRNLLDVIIIIATCFFSFKYGLKGLKEITENSNPESYKTYKVLCYIGIILNIICIIMTFIWAFAS